MTASPLDASRRKFLLGMCGAAALAAGVGPALLADDAAAATGITRRKDGRVAVKVSKVPALATPGGRALLGTVKGTPVAVIVRADGTYAALDLRCTHQGVTVREGGAGWLCPAHGSQFEVSGDVVAGPAIADLAVVPTRWVARTGQLIVG